MDIVDLVTRIEEVDIDSRYRLVIITAQRARQLMQGSKPRVSSKFGKDTTIGLHEIIEGKTEYLKGAEARAALKEARQKEAMAKSRGFLGGSEDTAEVKKDSTKNVDNAPPAQVPEVSVKE